MGSYPVKFGKYLLLDRINVGGMAEVFKAKTYGVAGFERVLAIKRILPSLVEDDEFIRMFIDEARIAVQLNHANIVQIYELGKHGEHYYIAMEYLPSRDLRAILDKMRSHGQLMPIPQAAYIISKVCEGLDYAHRRRDPSGQPMNIIHRDVSPQNVLITYEGEIKVIDFGIAKAANRASKTQAGVLKGKFGYMSPEQVRGLPIDRRSDVFAVGVLLYEMLTGERLFIGESDFSTLERVRNADVIPPTTFNKKISVQLEQIVLRALAREQEDRYQWASDLAEDLQRFLIEGSSVFTAKRLASYMKEAYRQDIASERAKMEEYLRAHDENDKHPRFLPSEAAAPATAAPATAALDPAMRPPAPLRDLDGPLPDEDDGSEEDKTFVISSSDAGQALEANAPTSAGPALPSRSKRKDSSGRALLLSEPTEDSFVDEVSLYGHEALELQDDAKTMVAFTSPFDEGHTDKSPPEHRAVQLAPPPNVPSTPGRAATDTLATPALKLPSEEMPEITAIGVSIPEPDPASVRAGHPDGGTDTDLAGPQLPSGAPPGLPPPPSRVLPAAPPPGNPEGAQPPRQGLSPPLLYGLVGGVGVTFLLFVGVVAFVSMRLFGGSTEGAGTAVLVSLQGPTPDDVRVLLDGQEVARELPMQLALPGNLPHTVTVLAEGHEPVEVQVPPLPAGQVLPLPVELVATAKPSDPATATQLTATQPTATQSATTSTDADGAPVAAAAPAERWRLSLTAVAGGVSVHGAEVLHAGRVLGLTPFEAEFPSSQARVSLELRAPGFAVKQVDVAHGGRPHVGPAAVELFKTPAKDGAPSAVPTHKATPQAQDRGEKIPREPPEALPAAPQMPPPEREAKAPASERATERPVAKPAPEPPPKARKPRPRRAAQRASPKRKQVTLAIGTRPYARVWVDGKRLARTTPLMGDRALKLRPGDYVFQFLDEKTEQKFRYRISLPASSEENKIIIILGKSAMVREGAAVVQELK